MERRTRPVAALRALLAALVLVLGGLSPTAVAAPGPHAAGAPYAFAGPSAHPHAHADPAHHGYLHAVPRSGRAAPAEQHVAHPAWALGPTGRYAALLRALPWPPVRRVATDGQQYAVGLRPARAPPSSHR